MSQDAFSSPKEESSVKVVDMWKRATPPPMELKRSDKLPMTRTTISQRLSGERSWLWTNLSQMSPSDQAVMISNIAAMWPYSNERRALNWPMHVGLLTNCLTSTLIATKISSDMVAFNPKMPFLEAVRTCPKSPFMFAVYSSGMAFYALRQILVTPYIFNENKPCSSCMLSRSVVISLISGIAMPILTTPYLCYYIMIQRDPSKYPIVKNYIDFLTLSWTGNSSARSVLLKLIPLQAAITAISTYALLWGRERIFSTLDSDPDFARELLISIQLKPTIKQRITDYLRSIPYFSDVVGKPEPETERLRVT
ncbi:hypothetical protein KIN20_027249 [Parelaphostrongylus tenuis]|uniref:Uncharacterized protein n=1 Tax=Parelaphostrongylus tenuis TaxID=148309 RepID=A0AAD5WDT9_PARTN|nr:hypothetical protein KIN20_027249 [Parelaphostrongylus tenuis]